MTKLRITRTWKFFQVILSLDLGLSLFLFFSDSLSEDSSVLYLVFIIGFILFSFGFYGNLAYKLSGRQLSSLIGFWKLILFIGYIPLYFHMRSLVRKSLVNLTDNNKDELN